MTKSKKIVIKHDVRLVDIETLLQNDWTLSSVEDSETFGKIVFLSYAAEGLHASFPPDGRPTFFCRAMDGGIEELPPPVALHRSGINLAHLPKPH